MVEQVQQMIQGTTDNGKIVAALLAVVTNWDATERRAGRRGEYRTTGASMYRIRELNELEAEQVKVIAGVLGVNLDDEEAAEKFSGAYEYQVSYASNRFATKFGGESGQRLTSNELRTLERAKQIILTKEKSALTILDRPDRAA